MLYQTDSANLFIGNKLNQVSKNILGQQTAESILTMPPFDAISTPLKLKGCYFQKQVHGIQGTIITENEAKTWIPHSLLRSPSFEEQVALDDEEGNTQLNEKNNTPSNNKNTQLFNHDGDFLVTNLSGVALGVLTADCLPIIMIDTKNKAIGIAHAGWRGSVQNISTTMLQALHNTYDTQQEDIIVYFGPSALPCCYEVAPEFTQNLDQKLIQQTIIKTQNKLYFNSPLYNQLILMEAGITEKQFNFTYNLCTICNINYCSFRREKEDDLRQITLVSLK